MIARRDDVGQRGADGSAIDLRQDRVEGRALPVAGDEDRDIVRIKARMPVHEGFENEGLVRLDDFAQRSRLVARGGREAITHNPTLERPCRDAWLAAV